MLDLEQFINGKYEENDLYAVVSSASELIREKRIKQQKPEGVIRTTAIGTIGVIEIYGDRIPEFLETLGDSFSQQLPDLIHSIFSGFWNGELEEQSLNEVLFYGVQQGFSNGDELLYDAETVRKFAAVLAFADDWYLQETKVINFS